MLSGGIGWLRRGWPLVICFGLSTLLSALMLFGLFRSGLEPIIGSGYPVAFHYKIETWHWISAWAALWSTLSIGAWLMRGRQTGILTCGLLAILIGAGAWIAGQTTALDISGRLVGASVLTVFWGGWLTIQFARLKLLWPADTVKSRSNSEDLTEHFGYVFLGLVGLALAASQSVWPGANLADRAATGEQFTPSLLFAALIVTSFLPLLTGFWLKARREAARQNRPFWRNDVVTPISFVIITVVILTVTTLAYYAALYASDTISAAISYATFVGVFLVFVLVIVLPHVLNFFRRRREDSIAVADGMPIHAFGVASLDAPAAWLSYLDTLLVKVIAPLSGGTQRRYAHVHVILILSLLSLLGLVIPRPFGLAPVALGILLAVALGRRWSWVEEDRETASRLERTRGANIHLGFENDLKDEALTGYAGLFILVPLTLYQIQDITGFEPVFDEQPGSILLTWIVFFGGELAKAVPFVDWWDIYGNGQLSSTGKHLTFLSRAAVDLIILAALFQALSIWQRNRVQSTLFKAGHLDAFDPFKEKEFFLQGVVRLRGDANALRFRNHIEALRQDERVYVDKNVSPPAYFEIRKEFRNQIKDHVEARTRLLRESSSVYEAPAPYSRQRLAELIEPAQHPDLRAGAQWMISRWNVLVGTPREQLRQIASRWANLQFPNAGGPGASPEPTNRRIQKMEFEKILVELAAPKWNAKINRDDVSNLMQCLRRVRDEDEFDFSRILAFELFARLRTVYAVIFLSKFVLREQDLNENDAWRQKMIVHADAPDTVMRLGRAEMRQRVYDALCRIASNPSAGDGARDEAYTMLEWMSHSDPAENSAGAHASNLAQLAAQSIEEAHRTDGEDPPDDES